MKYQVSMPDLTGNERKYLNECIDTNWVGSEGPMVKKFEKKYAEWHGKGYHCVTTSSGTTALELAVRALDLPEDSEIIIPTHTMIAVPNAVVRNGHIPVLVDTDIKDWNMDTNKIEPLITKYTKAILAVHTYGHLCNMEHIMYIAKKYDLKVIEDVAEAHGAEYKGRMAGTFGDIACYSFYGNKIITMGEGGACVTKDKELAEKMSYLRAHTFTPEKHFWHRDVGFNFRISSMQAAVGLAQLERIDEFIEKKRQIAEWYREELKDSGAILSPEMEGYKNVFWYNGFLVNERDALQDYLLKEGIDTRTFFIPIHRQPSYLGDFDKNYNYPVAEYLSKCGLYLPSSTLLTREDIKVICKVFKEGIANV